MTTTAPLPGGAAGGGGGGGRRAATAAATASACSAAAAALPGRGATRDGPTSQPANGAVPATSSQRQDQATQRNATQCATLRSAWQRTPSHGSSDRHAQLAQAGDDGAHQRREGRRHDGFERGQDERVLRVRLGALGGDVARDADEVRIVRPPPRQGRAQAGGQQAREGGNEQFVELQGAQTPQSEGSAPHGWGCSAATRRRRRRRRRTGLSWYTTVPSAK